MITITISEEVEVYEDRSVDGIEFEFDTSHGDEYVSITIGNQMITARKEDLKRAVASL